MESIVRHTDIIRLKKKLIILKMENKYYELDPDEGSIFVSISNLTEGQKEYIARYMFLLNMI